MKSTKVQTLDGIKVRGLSIEPCFSAMCIDLSMHVHVVKD